MACLCEMHRDPHTSVVNTSEGDGANLLSSDTQVWGLQCWSSALYLYRIVSRHSSICILFACGCCAVRCCAYCPYVLWCLFCTYPCVSHCFETLGYVLITPIGFMFACAYNFAVCFCAYCLFVLLSYGLLLLLSQTSLKH